MSEKIILLVEDNASDEALTLRALKKSNIANRVIVVRDGAEALDFLFIKGSHAERDRSLTPQVVLLDLQLPKIGGLDVLREMREDDRTKTLPVVVLTSSAEQQDIVRSYRLGANSFIQKPVDFTQFVESVKQLGLYWLVLNRLPPTDP